MNDNDPIERQFMLDWEEVRTLKTLDERILDQLEALHFAIAEQNVILTGILEHLRIRKS